MIRRTIRAARRRAGGWLRAHREGLRSALIAVLVVGLAAQSGALWSHVLTRDSIPWSGLRARLLSAETDAPADNSAGALPIRFAARGDDGLYGLQYNTDGLRDAYERTADVWAQALENAGELTPVGASDYGAALQNRMLWMEYDGGVPLYLLAGWLGSGLPEGQANRALGAAALCREGAVYALYLRDSDSGAVRRAETAVEDGLFDTALGQFEPNGCALAADTGAAASPDLLLVPGGETFDVVSFRPYGGGDGLDELLTAFGLDAAAAMADAYTADGVSVYVSGRGTVRIAGDGSMRYDGTGVRLPASRGRDRLVQCAQTGYELTCAALEAIDCGASAALTDAYTDKDGKYIVVYGLQIGGVPVDNAVTGYFARYEFKGDVLVHANLALRTCQTTGETIAVMPEKQVVASLGTAADAMLSLRYTDEAVGTGSSWEQLYDTADGVWGAENDADTHPAWQDDLDDTGDAPAGDTDGTLGTAWYDTGGTPVPPRWYVLRYGAGDTVPDFGRPLDPADVTAVQADFDRVIRGGGGS